MKKAKSPSISLGNAIEVKALTELKAAPWNPRKISDAALAGLTESLRAFGYVEPIVWNKRSGYVVGGHQRLKVLKAEGVESVPVIVVDLDETKERALNVALNNPHTSGTFDNDSLQEILAAIRADDDALYVALLMDPLEVIDDAAGHHDDDDDPSDKTPVIAYSLVFDDEDQQKTWFAFIKKLRAKGATGSIASLVTSFVRDALDLP